MSVAIFSLVAACGGDTVEYRCAHPTAAAVQSFTEQHGLTGLCFLYSALWTAA